MEILHYAQLESPKILSPLSKPPMGYYLAKRATDLCVSAGLLVMLGPVFVLAAIFIKLDSPGPVFFTQTRVGSKRIETTEGPIWIVSKFKIYKFRSMVQGASSLPHRELVAAYVNQDTDSIARINGGSDSGMNKLTNDPRLTRVGKLLRKYSIDELPQLWNVLNGTMSLVGPRPVPDYETEHYDNHAWKRLAGLPGLSGLWQVYGRGTLSFPQTLALDLDYLSRQSIWLDIKILAGTVKSVVSRKGAC